MVRLGWKTVLETKKLQRIHWKVPLSFMGLSQAHGLVLCPLQSALGFHNHAQLYVDPGVYADVAHDSVMTFSGWVCLATTFL